MTYRLLLILSFLNSCDNVNVANEEQPDEESIRELPKIAVGESLENACGAWICESYYLLTSPIHTSQGGAGGNSGALSCPSGDSVFFPCGAVVCGDAEVLDDNGELQCCYPAASQSCF